MTAGRPVYIAGSGTYLPGPAHSFEDIDVVLGELTEAPERIQRWLARTGPVMAELLDIKQLHYAIDPLTREVTDDNITMSVKAARRALDLAGIDAEAVDLICYGSAHQDQMPTASVRIQEKLGIERCSELSIHANCTSAYKALYLAHRLITSGVNHTALVISSGVSSSELRAEYYNQPLVDKESLFLRWFLSDGAGAILLSDDPARSRGFTLLETYIESIGGKRRSHMFNERPAYWMNPKQEFDEARHHLRQSFRNSLSTDVFREPGGAGSVFFAGFQRMLSEAGLELDDVALFQVNLPAKHISESVKEEFEEAGLPRERFYTKLDEYGYSGPPMALICLDQVVREERFEPGALVASFVTEVSKFMQAGYIARYDG